MTTQSENIKQSDLLHQLVLNRSTMEELGRIEMLWMYPQAHRVLGFICKVGFLSTKKLALKLSQVDALGENGILTHSQPEEADAEHVRQLESLIHVEVWSDAGRKIGKITDYQFNLKTGAIAHYLLTSDGLAGLASDIYQLSPNQILSLGRRRVLISEGIVSHLPIYREGLPHKLSKTGEHLKKDATQELRSLSQQAQSLTEQAKGRFQSLTGRAKERAQALTQQARETLQVLNEQVKEQAQTLLEEVKEKREVLTEQVVEHTHTFSRQVEEGIQTLTVQAEEIFDPAEKQSHPPASPINSPSVDEFDEIFGTDAIAPPPEQPPPTPPATSSGNDLENDMNFDEWDSPAASPTPPAVPAQETASTPSSQKVEDDDEPWI
jgi:uncharacterized protein YrrD